MGSYNLSKIVLGGSLGTLAMTILMYGWSLIGLPRMDIMGALGGVFPFDVSPYIVGSIIHLMIGISLALIYALFFYSWLPGPGWLRGAMFSLLPWIFAITLLGPSLQAASDFFKGSEAAAANPCSVSNPCTVRPVNPCAIQANPCSAGAGNPCAVSQNPCATGNPCGAGPSPSAGGVSPQTMSLFAHLLFGLTLGAVYRPSGDQGIKVTI